MVRKYKIFGVILVLIFCGCANVEENKIISIAVTGSPGEYSQFYEKGIKRAYADVCKEYKDSGFDIECNFYDDNDNYEEAEKITAQLVNDDSVTAILASPSAEICENQAYQTNAHDKILICPHWIVDSIIEENNYDKVFSLNYSSKNIGNIMNYMAEDLEAKKWAVCYADDKICKEEIKSFNNSDDVNVVDFVKVNTIMSDFNKVISRWIVLGVDGVVLIPYDDEGFQLLYDIKDEIPGIAVICDSSLDNDDELKANRKYFDNVYLVESFYAYYDSMGKIDDEDIDTWEIHGYNAFRIVVDTAIKNNTCDTSEIADNLHKDGYTGEFEKYKFDENGALIPEYFSVAKFEENDIVAFDIPNAG